MAKRYFELVEGTSAKFWEIWIEGTEVRTRYGRIGAAGQTTVKDQGSAAAATKLRDTLVAEKTKKGYVEQGGAGPIASPTASPAAPPATTSAAKVGEGTRDLDDGEHISVKGSGSAVYTLKNSGGVYTCSCPAWRNQGAPPERRTCKHLKALRGAQAEAERVGGEMTPVRAAKDPASGDKAVPPLLLAHSWEPDTDLTGWWMSEKLDGVRAYWDGSRLISRLGNAFVAPDWFIEALPRDLPLDGELFAGRKKFQRTVGIVRRQDRSDAWRELAYVVFDAPSMVAPFEARMRAVEDALRRCNAGHLRAHEHARCEGTDHLRAELARVEAAGGEGLMLRRPESLYEVGRSSTLLKVKSFKDAEARVVGHLAGAGRHRGRVGALACELPNGTKFSVGTGLSDDERRNPPPIGAVITFRYQELSDDGVPRFPSYVGVRDDVELPVR